MMLQIQQILMQILNILNGFTGNYGVAIILLAVIIKLVLYYPTYQQLKSMKDLQKVQPELKKLQEKYKEDPKQFQAEQMDLFKRHKINPLGGCLPLIIQMPILWAMFTTIKKLQEIASLYVVYTIKSEPVYFNKVVDLMVKIMPNAKTDHISIDNFVSDILKVKFLWINPAFAEKVNGLFNYHIIGSNLFLSNDIPLIILYGISMFISQKMTVVDAKTAESQKMMNLMMPIVFTFILFGFPSALILYWLVFNILSIIQQYLILKTDNNVPLEAGEISIKNDETLKKVENERRGKKGARNRTNR